MSYSETLRKIQGVANSLASLLDDFPHDPRPHSTLPLEEHFPRPQPLTSRLLTIGLDPMLADGLSQTYVKAALDLKSKYECKYATACSKLVSVSDHRGVSSTKVQTQFLDALIARYQGTLSLWAMEAMRKAELRRAKDISLQNKPSMNETKPARDSYIVVKTQISDRNIQRQKLAAKGFANPPCNPLSEESLGTVRPSYAFPSVYPPPDRDNKIPLHHLTRLQPLALSFAVKEFPSECDVERCIAALGRCSLSSGSEASQIVRPSHPSNSTLYSQWSSCISSSPTLSHADVHNAPRVVRLDTFKPTLSGSPATPVFKFSSKITPSGCRPASPMLYKPPTLTFKPEHTLGSMITLTSNLTSYTLQSDRKSKARKVAPLPRRTPGSGKGILHAPSDKCIGSPVSSSSRTPSLMSDRSCESNLSSPCIGPTTPPPSHSDLLPISLESDLPPIDFPSSLRSLDKSGLIEIVPNSTQISVSTECPV